MPSSRSRRAIATAAILALSPMALTASAQSTLPAQRLRPITSPVRDAGILHLASGTWTRKVSAAHLGADVIYNNSCDDGYYLALAGDTLTTNGRVPSPTSPWSPTSRPGCAPRYTIDGLEFGYCTDQANPLSITLDFYEAYGCCADPSSLTSAATIVLPGLPAALHGGLACWTLVVDLEAPPPDSQVFAMWADGDGSYDGGSQFVDSFGMSIRSSLPPAAAQHTGPILASGSGCQTCPQSDWDGTIWDMPVDYGESGTGMGTCATLRVDGGPTTPGCYFLGSCPDPNVHLRLFADACSTGMILTFCAGDGPGTPCPCGNPGTLVSGCANSTGMGASLIHLGTSSISADTLVFLGSQMPPLSSALYFQGTTQVNAGAGEVFGDGKRCVGGNVIRLGVETNSASGSSIHPRTGDTDVSVRGQITGPSTRTYQVWYRNSAPFCTPATFNLTNGTEVVWSA